MVFFHIDRDCSIEKTGVVFPYATPPKNPISKIMPIISQHGVHYLLHNEPHLISVLDEIILEYARFALFPDMPSRFQCLFANKSFEETQKWADYWDLQKYQIIEIESDKFYELDCSWFTDTAHTGTLLNSYLDNNIIHNEAVARIFEEAVKYWGGERSDTPRLEILIPLPFRVINIYRHYD